MKKKIFRWIVFLIGTVIPATSVTAQSNEHRELLLLPEKPEQTDEAVKPRLMPESTTPFPALSPSTTGMPLSPYENTLKFNPMLWNYNVSDTTMFLKHFSYMPFGQRRTYIGLGMNHDIGASILWSPTGKLSLETKIFISKQFGYMLSSRQVSTGAGLMLNYDITDKLRFRLRGQYVTPGHTDPFLDMMNLFPQTNVGADLQYKATEKAEVGMGVEYQFDKKSNTWKSEYSGKVKIGF